MRRNNPKSRTFFTNSLFGAFSLGIVGWALLHGWGIHMQAGLLFHALGALPGCVLSGIALYRYRQHWPSAAPASAWGTLAACAVLLGVGSGIALLVFEGQMAVLALVCIGMTAIPWTRLPACRDHFLLASAMLGTGALLALAVLGRPAHPLYYPLAAVLLLSAACALVIFAIAAHGNRDDRMPASGFR